MNSQSSSSNPGPLSWRLLMEKRVNVMRIGPPVALNIPLFDNVSVLVSPNNSAC